MYPLSVNMAKRGSTSFSATKVAKSGLITAKALERVLELEKEVSRLWHHVSVLSKRNHKLELRLGEVLVEGDRRGRKEEVAVPGRGVADEEEEAGVPDPVMVSRIVAVGDEDVVVSGVAGGVVAVSVEADEEEEVLVSLVRLPEGIKKRRLDEDGGSLEVTEDWAVMKAPLGPRGSAERGGRVASGVPTGPRGHVGPGFGMGPMGGRGRGRGFAGSGRVPFDSGSYPRQGFRPLGRGYLGPPFG